jgi:hypothetical protein
MAYLLKRTDQGGGYVQPAGSRRSYGRKETARRFPTKEDAERERCTENEVVVSVC